MQLYIYKCHLFISGSTDSGIRKSKNDKVNCFSHGNRLCNSILPNGNLTVRDPSAGTQFVQIQLLQVTIGNLTHGK